MTHTVPSDTLADPRVAAVINRMFELSEHDAERQQAAGEELNRLYRESTSAQERADLAAGIYMPVSRSGGELLYNLVRATRPATVVEFGMSFGISTLHLAAAVRDNGTGRVVTTELSKAKIAAAGAAFAEAGLGDLITVLEGDALQTLAGLDGEPGFLLLDGWKDLCLPVLKLLEPRLAPGTPVVADDITFGSMAPYAEYVRDPANGYRSVTFPVEDGMEFSCRL